jgi:protein-disulfide isomerase
VRIMLARFAGRETFAFRHFPLEEPHPHALHAALAAEAAGAQAKFWPMHDVLFQNQAHLEVSDLRRYAERLELDMARYDAEMAGSVHLPTVRAHISECRRSGVRGTPGFFINGIVQDVSFGMEHLLEGVEKALR